MRSCRVDRQPQKPDGPRVNASDIMRAMRKPQSMHAYRPGLLVAWTAVVLLGCQTRSANSVTTTEVSNEGAVEIRADFWADNWFAFFLNDELIIEDSVPITTERSFNAESVVFRADYPLQLNFVLKDFLENDTGLEYIGKRNQQMGDGGFIAQFYDTSNDELIMASNAEWKCLVIHEAPLDKTCESEANPAAGEGPCGFVRTDEPTGWKALDFDDSSWPLAIEHDSRTVRPKGGYDQIDWHERARLIWSSDLETHNTLLCRVTVSSPSPTQ